MTPALSSRSRSHLPLLAFAASLLAIYGVSVWIVGQLAQLERAAWVAAGLTIDLTLFVPVLWWVLLVLGRGWPRATVLPAFLGSVALAYRMIPENRQQVLEWISYVAVLVELALVGLVIHKTLAIRQTYRCPW